LELIPDLDGAHRSVMVVAVSSLEFDDRL